MRSLQPSGGLLLTVVIAIGFVANASAAERENRYIAAGSVSLDFPVPGDVYAAGGSIEIDRRVDGDVVASGGTINVTAPIGEDLRVAGGSIKVGSDIGGEMMAAGGQITIGPNVRIGGKLRVAAGSVTVTALVEKPVRIFAERVRLAGRYEGDVEVAAKEIEVAAETAIAGKLRYASELPPKVDPSAKIAGGVSEWSDGPQMKVESETLRQAGWYAGWLMLGGLFVAGLLLVVLFPTFTSGASGVLREMPWASLLIGLALMLALPPLTVLLLVTVIGIPLALILFVLYPLLLVAGYLTAAIALGDRLLATMWASRASTLMLRVIFLAVALLAFVALGWIPYAGFFLLLLILIFGLGAFAIEAFHRRRGAKVA